MTSRAAKCVPDKFLTGTPRSRGGSTAQLQVFLVISTCVLYLVAAGLFSRAVGYFEQQRWNNIIGGDATELGDGPGTYDIDSAVWHLNVRSPSLPRSSSFPLAIALKKGNNTAPPLTHHTPPQQCCSPDLNGGGGWGIFQAILGWNNTATYGAVISYNLYWLVVILAFLVMRFKETKGHYPFMSGRAKKADAGSHGSTTSASRSEEATRVGAD